MSDTPTYAELQHLAATIASDVGNEARGRRNGPLSFETKTSPADVVTEVDTWAETVIVERLNAARPADGFLGEEGTNRESATGITWVIDPIDGTTNLLYDLPGYSVSIAARTPDHVVAGAVFDPVRGELFQASVGNGATRTDETGSRTVQPSNSTELATSLIGTGFSYLAERRAEQAVQLQTILPRVRDIRRAGGAALDFCAVACGRLDAYYEHGLSPWDSAAGALIAAEAGAITVEGELSFAVAPGIARDFALLLNEVSV